MEYLDLSQEALAFFALRLSKALTTRDAPRQPLVIALSAPMGCGKTTFVRAFVQAVAHRHGIKECVVPSPTYSLTQIYEWDDVVIRHHDFYRLENPADAFEADFDLSLQDGLSFIEWGDKLKHYLPQRRFDLYLSFADAQDRRHVSLQSAHRELRQWLIRQEL